MLFFTGLKKTCVFGGFCYIYFFMRRYESQSGPKYTSGRKSYNHMFEQKKKKRSYNQKSSQS